MKKNSGYNLLEVVLALGLFFVLMTGVALLASRYVGALTRAVELQDVSLIASETQEALDKLASSSWASLTDGPHGLTTLGSDWQLSGSSDLINSKYTRQITVASVNRDSSCNLVTSGGTADPDTKTVVTQLSWTERGQNLSKSFYSYVTNWRSPSSSCLIVGQAGGLGLNTGTATRNEYFDWINFLVTIDNVRITNNYSGSVTIDKVQVYFDKPGMKITNFKINGSTRWGWLGPGSPGGMQSSDAILDISNYTFTQGQTVTVKMQFTTSSSGPINFHIKFIMTDLSEVETNGFTL